MFGSFFKILHMESKQIFIIAQNVQKMKSSIRQESINYASVRDSYFISLYFWQHFDATANKFNRKQRRRGSNNTSARSRRGSNQNALTKIMESVTLVLSGTLLALQYSGNHDKYLWLLLSYWARTMTFNSIFFFFLFRFFFPPRNKFQCSFIIYKFYEQSCFHAQHKILNERFLTGQRYDRKTTVRG